MDKDRKVISEKFPNQIKFVVLSEPMQPAIALAFGVYPKSLSNEDTIKLLLSIFDEQERVKFINSIADLAERNATPMEIGMFVSQEVSSRSVRELKYVFGDRKLTDVGLLLKTYSEKGDIAAINYEISKDIGEVAAPVKRKSNIVFEDVERFLISMS